MTGDSSRTFELTFTSRPENLILGREVCGGLLELWGATPVLIDDVKTALTEACDNAIIHGYLNSPDGSITVLASGSPSSVELSVRDSGDGFSPNPGTKGGLGMGLPLIATLADQYEVSGRPYGGTEVRMSFSLNSSTSTLSPKTDQADNGHPGGTAVLTTDLHSLIPRFVLAAGAGTELDVDRLSDLELAVDLATQGIRPGTMAVIQVDAEPDGLRCRIGPLEAERVTNLEAIRRLTERADIEEADSSQSLVIAVRAAGESAE